MPAFSLGAPVGLGVVQGERSLSGVEYDPDRPLCDIIAGPANVH